MSARQIQIRRGTEAEHANFTGAIGEVTMDTTNKTLRVHDGETVGGTILAKKDEIPDINSMDYVVETQEPTAENNYIWFRRYKSGWVEQGGYANGNIDYKTNILYLPVRMLNNRYVITAQSFNLEGAITISSQTQEGFTIFERVYTNTWYYHKFRGYWRAEGYAMAS